MPADLCSQGQSIGIVVSLAIAGTIFQNRAIQNTKLTLPGIDTSRLRSAITGTDSMYFASLGLQDRQEVIKGIVEALRDVYIAVIVAGAVVVLLAVFLPRKKLFSTN